MADLLVLAILSVFQGLFEWLPISSEGISVFLMVNVLKLDPGPALSYAIFFHIGTMLAVLFRFRSDFVKFFSGNNGQLARMILVATFFTALTAIPLMTAIREFRSGELVNALIGVMLITTGLVLRLPGGGLRSLYELKLAEVALLGLIQGFAIIPGISRSGVTVSFLLVRKLNEEHALKFSFLLSVPAVLGAVFLDSFTGSFPKGITPFSAVVVILITFIIGYVTMDLLLRFARRANFSAFCIILGTLSIITAIILWI